MRGDGWAAKALARRRLLQTNRQHLLEPMGKEHSDGNSVSLQESWHSRLRTRRA